MITVVMASFAVSVMSMLRMPVISMALAMTVAMPVTVAVIMMICMIAILSLVALLFVMLAGNTEAYRRTDRATDKRAMVAIHLMTNGCPQYRTQHTTHDFIFIMAGESRRTQ